MLSELNFILLLQLNIILDILIGSLPGFLLYLFVLLVELYLVGQCELHDLGVRDELFVLV